MSSWVSQFLSWGYLVARTSISSTELSLPLIVCNIKTTKFSLHEDAVLQLSLILITIAVFNLNIKNCKTDNL